MSITSSGTKALRIFYFWYLKIQEKKASFLFIDEFDAFYHHDLSWLVIKMLKKITGTQIILTTHNTSNISNDLLRPDCYFIMDNEKIQPMTNLTDRELREGHNIEKMYKAGSFE
jgi:AAA15 family ATPase/GTPase